ncbi:MAG: lipid-A-disaccharide synthase [Hyphomonadaceae bacterium]|nr:lipid-A-disaccharide synthase [Hyphomonadaceae bacterium]
MSKRVFLVAAEASGDALGADLVKELKRRVPAIELSGVGGELMARQGIASQADTSGLAVLGFVDGLKAYDRVKRAVAATVAAIQQSKPDAVVLIDSWGFTLRVAQGVRAAAPHIKLVKYIGPQVWATRPGRARTLAATVDHLICIHDFEPPFYEPYGLRCTVCGHPALGRFAPGDAAALRARLGISANQRLVLVLPGSRHSEIRRVGPTLWRAAEELRRTRPDVRLMTVAARAVREAALSQAPADVIAIDEDHKEDAFAAASLALAASGTVTTEVALQGAPLVIGYKLGWITWAIARAFLFRAKFATLMNVAADEEVAPERLQTRFTVANLVAAAAPLLDDPAARAAQIARQNHALALMGRGGRPAAEIAAQAILDVVGCDQPRDPTGT